MAVHEDILFVQMFTSFKCQSLWNVVYTHYTYRGASVLEYSTLGFR